MGFTNGDSEKAKWTAILNRIEDHLSQNDILCKYQFGFTKNSNCDSAVLHVMNQIYINKEKKAYNLRAFHWFQQSVWLTSSSAVKIETEKTKIHE